MFVCLKALLPRKSDAADVLCIILSLGGYTLNTAVLRAHTTGLFFSGYFNDICAGVFICAFADYMLARLYERAKYLKFGFAAPFILLIGAFWEYITPLYRADAVADAWDIAAYFAGMLIFMVCHRIVKAYYHTV